MDSQNKHLLLPKSLVVESELQSSGSRVCGWPAQCKCRVPARPGGDTAFPGGAGPAREHSPGVRVGADTRVLEEGGGREVGRGRGGHEHTLVV